MAGLQFTLSEVKGSHTVYIDANNQEDPFDRSISITVLDEAARETNYNQMDFDSIDIEDILQLGMFLNVKLGFELINISEVEKQIKLSKQSCITHP